MNSRPDVLVVGAGPTGLALALQAHDHGARVRVVERRTDALRPSRALIVHSRTLEVLRPLGVVESLLRRADTAPKVQLHLGTRMVPVSLAEMALPDTPFPHLTFLRQMDVETLLAGALADREVRVERGTELIGVRVGDPTADAGVTLRTATGIEETKCGAVVGCDGADSTVRTLAGIGWRGAAYREEVLLADVEIEGDLAHGVAHVAAGRRGLMFVFSLGESATWRLLATRPAGGRSAPPGLADPQVTAGELQRLLDNAGLAARITDVRWSSRVPLQHGIADRYREGPVFLAGDAAHVHSPAGGQGMNTGIQDAVNLGWKLAFASASSNRDALLKSYEDERRPVARQVLALTNLAFWAESSTGPLAAFARGVLAPLGAPMVRVLPGRRALIAQGFRVLSQLNVSYRGSTLSVEGTPAPRGGPHAGDRLPDATVGCGGRDVRLHELIAAPGVHLLLHRDAQQPGPAVRGRYIHLHTLTSLPGSGVIAVRPDGYVGFRSSAVDDEQLAGWLARIGATA